MGLPDRPPAPLRHHPLRACAHLVRPQPARDCMHARSLLSAWIQARLFLPCRLLYGYLQPLVDTYLDDPNTRKVNEWASSLTFVSLNWCVGRACIAACMPCVYHNREPYPLSSSSDHPFCMRTNISDTSTLYLGERYITLLGGITKCCCFRAALAAHFILSDYLYLNDFPHWQCSVILGIGAAAIYKVCPCES